MDKGQLVTKVFVSGCYDILHGGHIQFFRDARALGDHLTVCFASDATIRAYKKREPAMPQEHRRAVLESLWMVDQVVMGEDCGDAYRPWWLDFMKWANAIRPNILAVTEDDKLASGKQDVLGSKIRVVVLPKTIPGTPISTTAIRERAGL